MTSDTVLVPAWPMLPNTLDGLLIDIKDEEATGPPHPRPWDLAALPDPLRETTWEWLDGAVRWINLCFGWQPHAVIPPCWRRHLHLAIEIAVLAFGRELARRTAVPDQLRGWHEQLHAFHVRMAEGMGESGLADCQRGRHGDRPSAYELEQYERHR